MRTNDFFTPIFEKTFPTAKDVDYIYKTYYADMFRQVKNGTWDGIFQERYFPSTDLPSAMAKKASKINPVTIWVAVFNKKGNSYNPTGQLISITTEETAFRLLLSNYGSIKSSLDMVRDNQRQPLSSEYDGTKLRTSISHELSHWFDDTFHNQHLYKMLGKGQAVNLEKGEAERSKVLTRGKPNIFMTPYEINAQIHQIKELKRKYRRQWDKLSFDEMMVLDNTIGGNANKLSPGNFAIWKRHILKRMAREGLLGASMTRTAA